MKLQLKLTIASCLFDILILEYLITFQMTNSLTSRLTNVFIHNSSFRLINEPFPKKYSFISPSTRTPLKLKGISFAPCLCLYRQSVRNYGILVPKNAGKLFNGRSQFLGIRNFWNGPMSPEKKKTRITSTMYYLAALGVLTVGASYAAVPLYRIFCAVSSSTLVP